MADSYKDKTPPHDDELEQAALGSMLSDSDAVTAAIQAHLKKDDFYSRANQNIYDAILRLDANGKRPDIQTVVQELKKMGKLDEAGGASFVANLTTVIPSSVNIDYYAEMVKNYSLKRSLIKLASNISVKAYDESKDGRKVLEEVQQNLFKLSEDRQVFSARKISEVLKETVELIDRAMKSKNPITGVPSGYDKLDQFTAGFQKGEFIILGARPSVGKTAFALNMAAKMAFHKGIPVGFFSLEMNETTLCQRLISSEGKIPGQNIRSGFLSSNDYTNMLKVMAFMYEGPLYLIDMPNMQLNDLRAQARKMRTQQGVEIIFIDYIGLIQYESQISKRFEQISDISRSLKSLARELNIPIVVLCQLTRDAQFEVPTLAHLRDSGSIEQDADIVLFLHIEQPKKAGRGKDKEEEKPVYTDKIPTDLIIAKQRNGPIGTVKLERIAKYAYFTEAMSDKDHLNNEN